ncbi:MAG: sporulation transcriptional regulator SpoIIID [Bacilli bacterium]|nr:sporulation transcriptional regulator SpoIIID [Bacilli bacterium]
MKGTTIEERATELAHYIIDSKDTVRGAAAKYGVSKSTVHTVVTFRNGLEEEVNSREEGWFNAKVIRGVFLSKKNPVVNLKLLVK